jgi:ABC-type transport system substrate-binding protein
MEFSQRADLIADLVAGQAQSAYDADRPYWTRQLAIFKRGYDVIGQWILENARPDVSSTAELISETAGRMTGDDLRADPDNETKLRIKVETLNLTAGTDYFIFVYADREAPIAIFLKDSQNQTQANNINSHWYPGVSFKPTSSGPFSLVVVSADADVTYKVRLYAWRPGAH